MTAYCVGFSCEVVIVRIKAWHAAVSLTWLPVACEICRLHVYFNRNIHLNEIQALKMNFYLTEMTECFLQLMQQKYIKPVIDVALFVGKTDLHRKNY